MRLGRKPGGKNKKYKLTDKEDQLIRLLVVERKTKTYTAKRLGVSVTCLNAHIKRMKDLPGY